jgi:hypothetical protein
MTTSAKKTVVSLFASAAVVAGVAGAAGPAAASDHIQDGLINIAIGDITVKDINVNVGAQVAAAICDLKVGPVVVLGRVVDRSGDSRTVCESEMGDIVFENN